MKYLILGVVALALGGCGANIKPPELSADTASKVVGTETLTPEKLNSLLTGVGHLEVTGRLLLIGKGSFDFRSIPVSYSGSNKRCGKSTRGSNPFITISGDDVTVKNLTVRKSAPDGINITGNSKVNFENLVIWHSCDEGLAVRRGAKIVLSESKIVSQFNKAIQFDGNNEASLFASELISEQAFSLNNSDLKVTVENSTIQKHPSAPWGRVVTGSNCSNISVTLKNTQVLGVEQLDGTKNCSNVLVDRQP